MSDNCKNCKNLPMYCQCKETAVLKLKAVDTASLLPTAKELAETAKIAARKDAISRLRAKAQNGEFFYIATGAQDWFIAELVSNGFRVRKFAEETTVEGYKVKPGNVQIEW